MDRSAVMVCFSRPISPRHALMLRSLKDIGYHVTVLVWDRAGDALPPDELEDVVDHWKWIRLPAPVQDPRILARMPRLYWLARKALRSMTGPDLLVLTHMFLLPLAFGRGVSRTARPVKTIYEASEIHAMQASFYFGRLSSVARPFISLIERLLLWRVDGVLTVDSKGGWVEKRYRKVLRPVQVIWNVSSKADEPDPERVEALKDEYAGRKVVAYVGGLSRVKGFRVAIEAAAKVRERHPDVLFLFIGIMQDDEKAVQEMIRAMDIEENIRILELMPYREMMAHLRHALIGLAPLQPTWTFPWLAAGNGRKFFTYMQAGIPVIGPNVGELGESVNLAGNGMLVDTQSADAIADAVNGLLDAPERARSMGAAGRRAFEERFNWEKEQAKFLDFIEKVTGACPPTEGMTA